MLNTTTKESVSNTSSLLSERAVPLVVLGKGVDPDIHIDPIQMADTMRELGISEEGIANSTTYFDPANRHINNGTHYPNRLGRLRFRHIPELQNVDGDIVRITTHKRGKPRSAELMGKTWVHEMEHVAQAERKDTKVTAGHVAIWGLAAAGALAGHRLGRGSRVAGPVATALGAYIGHSVGYTLAPHERQARARAGQTKKSPTVVTTYAIKRKTEK